MSKTLTGSKRIIYDSCISSYNAVQKWRSIIAEAHAILINIYSVKQPKINEAEPMDEGLLDCSEDMYEKLEGLSSSLLIKLENLDLTVKKMQSAVAKIKSICEISDLHHSCSSDFSFKTDSIPFKTWSLSKFNDVIEKIATMFEKELGVKSAICENICHITNKAKFLYYEWCWKYELNIDTSRLNMLLTGIIFELDLISDLN